MASLAVTFPAVLILVLVLGILAALALIVWELCIDRRRSRVGHARRQAFWHRGYPE